MRKWRGCYLALMKTVSLLPVVSLALAMLAPANAHAVSTYKNVKVCEHAADKKAPEAAGTLNLDPEQRNLLFVVRDSVRQTIPYQAIFSLEFYMQNHLLRVLYRGHDGQERYLDLDLPRDRQHDVLKSIQDQTGLAVRLI
jgi:hypothetical protein